MFDVTTGKLLWFLCCIVVIYLVDNIHRRLSHIKYFNTPLVPISKLSIQQNYMLDRIILDLLNDRMFLATRYLPETLEFELKIDEVLDTYTDEVRPERQIIYELIYKKLDQLYTVTNTVISHSKGINDNPLYEVEVGKFYISNDGMVSIYVTGFSVSALDNSYVYVGFKEFCPGDDLVDLDAKTEEILDEQTFLRLFTEDKRRTPFKRKEHKAKK